jgi:hypothetical protein
MSDKDKLDILWKIDHLMKCGVRFRYLSTRNSMIELEIEYSIGKYMHDEDEKLKQVIDAVKNNNTNTKSVVIEYINEGKGHIDKLKYSCVWNDVCKILNL